MLIVAALAAFALWWWLGKKRQRIPAIWLGIGGTLAGAILAARGQPVIGALIATGSGLWLRYGEQLLGKGTPPAPPPPAHPALLNRAEAADLLGVPINADRETILAAYRSLIARNHPDHGGSPGLAARINAARDLLLKTQDY